MTAIPNSVCYRILKPISEASRQFYKKERRNLVLHLRNSYPPDKMFIALGLVAFATFLIYILFFRRSKNDFWEKHGVPHLPHSTAKDNFDIFVSKKITPDFDEIVYKSLGENGKFCGFTQLGSHFFLPKDLDLVKKILIKDFDHFVDRRSFASSKSQPVMDKMLANMHGEQWKTMRTTLSPTFTTGKIRRMMEYFNKVSNEWANHFNEEIKKNGGKNVIIKVNKEVTTYTVDVIAAAVFGMNAETIKQPDNLVSKMAQQLTNFTLWSMIKFGLSMNVPWIVNLFNLKVIDDEGLTFFMNVLGQKLKERESTNEKRNDFLQLILEARKGDLKGKGSDELDNFEKDALLNDSDKGNKDLLKDDSMAIAQMLGFFFAGFSTTSNFISTVMYTLALHQDVQDKLRHEINNSNLFQDGEDDMDYDELNKLVYLDMVLCEVLRLYPALARLERICEKEYNDPEHGFTIPKGAVVAIPVQAIHMDPKYYEHPDKFYPEHFAPEVKANRNPYSWLPFGTGPRNCIGMRFALVESKAAIAHLVKKFKLEPSKKTPVPQTMKASGIAMQTPDNLELKLSPV